MAAREFQDIIIIVQIQTWVQSLLQLEEFYAVAIIAQLYYIFLGIQKPRKQLIILDMVEFTISNILKLLVVTITGF